MKAGFTPRELKKLRAEADEQYENMRGSRFYRRADFLLYVAAVMVAAFAIRAFLVEPIRVDGDSMTPTLLNGEHMLVEKMSFWTREPARGEIVICYYPGYTESCVKRVVGLPGDTVCITGGALYINGAALNESAYWDGVIYGETEQITVGRDEVFVMGDNRNGSKDSRNTSVGCIPYNKIVGRVAAVIWPVSACRNMPGVQYAS